MRVLKAISDALNLSVEALLARAGLADAVAGEATDSAAVGQQPGARRQTGIEGAIRADERLTGDQKAALIAVTTACSGSCGMERGSR